MKFTPSEILAMVVALCGLALTILNIIDKGMIWHSKAEEPQQKLKEEVDKLRDRVEDLEIKQAEATTRAEQASYGGEIVMRSLLALLSNAIDGNTEDLQDARKELNNFLTRRKEI